MTTTILRQAQDEREALLEEIRDLRRTRNAVILAHNHPSGDPAPSDQDIALTKRLVEAGALLGIEVLDHLILGAEDVVSLAAMGVISRRGGRRRS
jgi:DNA repair protein RadC